MSNLLKKSVILSIVDAPKYTHVVSHDESLMLCWILKEPLGETKNIKAKVKNLKYASNFVGYKHF